MLSKDQVKHISQLARIELSEKEIKKYQAQLGKVLDYFDKLKQVKTKGVETADGGTRELYNIWRDDKQRSAARSEQDLIDMVPEKKDGQVRVKLVF